PVASVRSTRKRRSASFLSSQTKEGTTDAEYGNPSDPPRWPRKKRGAAHPPHGTDSRRPLRWPGRLPGGGRERQGRDGHLALGVGPQYDLHGQTAQRRAEGHAEGLAGGSRKWFPAARGSAACRDGRAHTRQGAGTHLRRAAGSEAPGRHLRDGDPRSRNRMLAHGDPGRVQGGGDGTDDRQAAPRGGSATRSRQNEAGYR